jgi:hypothetical protein
MRRNLLNSRQHLPGKSLVKSVAVRADFAITNLYHEQATFRLYLVTFLFTTIGLKSSA